MRAENTTWREDMGEPDAGATATVSVEDVDYHAPRTALFAATLPEDFYAPAPAVQTAPGRDRHLDELFEGLVLGLRDYYEKVGAFERFLVALSGGRDSALCLLIAVAAAKAFQAGAGAQHFARHVHAAYLPNRRYSSAATEAAARALAEELGVPFRVLAIDGETHVAQQFTEELAGGADKVSALARQNLQARIRGAVMLNWANSVGGLVLVTSNLSEAAVGYTTTGGDNEGGFSPIANLPKTLVSRLLEYLARRDGIAALEKVLAIPPSAELAPDQLDEADLMPYVVLDDLLYLYARKRLLLADCWRLLCARHPQHAPEQLRTWTADFARRFAQSQWKRDQHPVSLKVMDLDLDPKTGFRFPVTQSIAHELAALQAATLD
jgi:NAD+ synthase (glutamine-hydrolysing)